MLRLFFFALLALSPGQPSEHLSTYTPEPELQLTEEYQPVHAGRCFIFVNENGDVTDRCE